MARQEEGCPTDLTCKTGATEVLYRATTRGMFSVPTLTVDSRAVFSTNVVRLEDGNESADKACVGRPVRCFPPDAFSRQRAGGGYCCGE